MIVVDEDVSLLEKADHLDDGMLRKIPAEAEMFVGMRNVDGVARDFLSWFEKQEKRPGFLVDVKEGEVRVEGGALSEELEKNQEVIDENAEKGMKFLEGIGRESFLCLLDGGADKVEFAVESFQAMSRGNQRLTTGIFRSVLRGEEEEEVEDDGLEMRDSLGEFLGEHLKSEMFEMPDFLMGLKLDDGELMAELRGAVREGFANDEWVGGEVKFRVEATDREVVRGGVAFEALELKFIPDAGEGLINAEVLGEELAGRLIEKMGGREQYSVVMAHGEWEGYFLMFVGDSLDDLKLVEDVEESLLGHADFAPLRETGDRRVLGLQYFSEELMESMVKLGQPGVEWQVVGEVFEEGRDDWKNPGQLAGVLKRLADLEKQEAGTEVDAWAGVWYLDEGLRYEGWGGRRKEGEVDSPDWVMTGEEALKPFCRIRWSRDFQDRNLSQQQVRKGLDLLRLLAEEFGERQEMDAEDAEEFERLLGEYDGKVHPNVVGLLEGWGKFAVDGVGDDGFFVMDLKGGMPKVPGVSARLVEEGKVPRMLWGSSVRDRESIGEAWEQWVESGGNLIELIPEGSGVDLSWLSVLSADGGGLTSHFLNFPGVTKDFLPNVSLNGEFFSVGTSRQFAQEVYGAMATSGPSGQGGWLMEVDAAPLKAWVKGWIELMNAERADEGEEALALNDEPLMGEGEGIADYDLFGFIQGVRWHQWVEGGRARSTFHLRIEGVK